MISSCPCLRVPRTCGGPGTSFFAETAELVPTGVMRDACYQLAKIGQPMGNTDRVPRDPDEEGIPLPRVANTRDSELMLSTHKSNCLAAPLYHLLHIPPLSHAISLPLSHCYIVVPAHVDRGSCPGEAPACSTPLRRPP